MLESRRYGGDVKGVEWGAQSAGYRGQRMTA